MIRTLAVLGLTLTLLAGGTAAAVAATVPVGPTGTGPSTSVTGWYRVVDAAVPGPWLWADPAADVTFPLPAYSSVEVIGDLGSCVVPDTREAHRSADDHQAVCLSVPEVTAAWARTTAVHP